jgi:hypothetical protein
MPSSACERSTKYHGRGNATYETCSEHTECLECQKEIHQNLSSLYQSTRAGHYDLCIAHGNSHADCMGQHEAPLPVACDAYCDTFLGVERDTCIQSCLYDGNSFGSHIEDARRNKEAEWLAYRHQITRLTTALLVKMRSASTPDRRVVQQTIEQLVAMR